MNISINAKLHKKIIIGLKQASEMQSRCIVFKGAVQILHLVTLNLGATEGGRIASIVRLT